MIPLDRYYSIDIIISQLDFKAENEVNTLEHNIVSHISLLLCEKVSQLSFQLYITAQKPKHKIIISVNAKTSSCLDTSSFAAKLSYQWEITPSAGINLPNTITPRLIIPAR